MKSITQEHEKVEPRQANVLPLASADTIRDLWRSCLEDHSMPAINSKNLELPHSSLKRLHGFDFGAARSDEKFDALVSPECKLIDAYAPGAKPVAILQPHDVYALHDFGPCYPNSTRSNPFMAFLSDMGDPAKTLCRAAAIIEAYRRAHNRVTVEWNGRLAFVATRSPRMGSRLFVARKAANNSAIHPVGFGWLRRNEFFRHWVSESKFVKAIVVRDRFDGGGGWQFPHLDSATEKAAALVIKDRSLPTLKAFMAGFPGVELIVERKV